MAALSLPAPAQVTVHKGDTCQLLGPAQPSHWEIQSGTGSKASMPAVCFLVPPPNPEALEAVARWVAGRCGGGRWVAAVVGGTSG